MSLFLLWQNKNHIFSSTKDAYHPIQMFCAVVYSSGKKSWINDLWLIKLICKSVALCVHLSPVGQKFRVILQMLCLHKLCFWSIFSTVNPKEIQYVQTEMVVESPDMEKIWICHISWGHLWQTWKQNTDGTVQKVSNYVLERNQEQTWEPRNGTQPPNLRSEMPE